MSSIKSIFLFISVLLVTALASASEHAPGLHAVRMGSGENIVLDGKLSAPVWQRAPIFSAFVEKSPKLGGKPEQETWAQVIFDEHAIYVGITAFDTEANLIAAPLVRRDGIEETSDFVDVYIDSLGMHQSAQFFRVNAAGSKSDGIYTANDDNEDLAPDFDFATATARHPNGYTMVVKIPFSSLRFISGGNNGWRMMIVRNLPHQNFATYTSVLIAHDAPSLIASMPLLHGIEIPQQSHFLTLRPSMTLRHQRDEANGTRNTSEAKLETTLDLKWRPIPELIIDGTLRPDFSQLDLDVPQLAGNTRFALAYPEKRPFFFEASDLLRSPSNALYTRSFTEPAWGARATWRGKNLAGTAILANDRGGGQILLPNPYGTDVIDQPASKTLILRGSSGNSTLQTGIFVAARHYANGAGRNTIFGPDLTWRPNDRLLVRAELLGSQTRAIAFDAAQPSQRITRTGSSLYLHMLYQTEAYQYDVTLLDISNAFRNDSGFVNQVGIQSYAAHYAKVWRHLGFTNELWANFDVTYVRERESGKLIKSEFVPGIWFSAPNNTKGSVELHGLSVARTGREAPLLHERYVSGKVSTTLSNHIPSLETSLALGQLPDVSANTVRPGLRWSASARARLLPQLEVEPSISLESLRRNGQQAYRESVTQLKAVWFLTPNSDVRLIVQKTALNRTAEPGVMQEQDQSRTGSLIYTWRHSIGTAIFMGLSNGKNGIDSVSRSREFFVKLQIDADEIW